MQIFCADWNAGGALFVLPGPAVLPPGPPGPIRIPIPRPPGPAVICGSGKFGTPCVRMHCAIFSAPCLSLAICAVVSGGPWGRSFRHFWNAACKVDCATETPPIVTSPFDPPPNPTGPPFDDGSGKLGTPLARMQWAIFRPALARLLELAVAEPAFPLLLDPPQPASSAAAASTQPTGVRIRSMAPVVTTSRLQHGNRHLRSHEEAPRICGRSEGLRFQMAKRV